MEVGLLSDAGIERTHPEQTHQDRTQQGRTQQERTHHGVPEITKIVADIPETEMDVVTGFS